jgi:leader peptidase (prepilin peptidase) / N-methyltransferase
MLLIISGFLIGLVFGSFFGCCVYRLPRGISLIEPRFSFCPACQKTIAWYYNIPVLGWLWLRGRCHECGARIDPRYPLIEALTGVFFGLAVWRFGFPLAIPICIFGSLLILITFIDIEFFLIPDLLSKPGILLGVAVSLFFPELHSTSSRLVAGGKSVAGALVGGGILFLISELGKLAFGRYKVVFPDPVRFSFQAVSQANDSERQRTAASDSEEGARILIDDEPFLWEDHFFRKNDRIRIRADQVTINGEEFQQVDLIFYHDRIETGSRVLPLTELSSLVGRTAYAEFPREAMGLGDVKLMAAIGGFTGWLGILFTIAIASVVSAVYGVSTILAGHRDWSAKIPFGPYLAIGAILWVFCGRTILHMLFG